jgi:metal-responsive CopG/Arc/MetJ family transcriptional regulator
MMAKKAKAREVKGISAPPEWWHRLEAAQKEMGIVSRSNFIRIAVDDYLKGSLADNRQPGKAPA